MPFPLLTSQRIRQCISKNVERACGDTRIVLGALALNNLLKEIIISMRPKQWYKNLILFVGIVFSRHLSDFSLWPPVILGFVVFCIISGGDYIINDIIDSARDKRHPTKSERPIASGRLKKPHAIVLASILILLALAASYSINFLFFLVVITFFFLQNLYTLFFKHIILVDVLGISTNFVVRAIAGCLAIKVLISPWLIICAFLLALYLALGKRRHELVLLGEEAKGHREILEDYSIEMLDQFINITAGALIISYSLYTFLADNIYMMLTVPFAVYGLFRYLFLVHAKNFGGETALIFRDKGMLLSMFLWAVLVVIILYGIPERIIMFVE
jgi:4-hydroxybenzoate polyprenyltransferase